MARPLEKALATKLMQNITLLSILNEVPEACKQNTLLSTDGAWRQLSIQDERSIAEFLAFLSATEDGIDNITAVCLEEGKDHNHLTIRVASNSGNFPRAMSGLSHVAKILEKASHRVQSEEEDYTDLFRQVIYMDWPKILCRLRLRHQATSCKKKDKRSPLLQLQEALSRSSSNTTGSTDLEVARGQVRALVALYHEIETLHRHFGDPQSLGKLFDLIQALEAFANPAAQSLVQSLSYSPSIDPGTTNYLQRAIAKLVRYSSASRFLVQVARKQRFSIFDNITVDFLKTSRPAGKLFTETDISIEEACRNVMNRRTCVGRPKASLLPQPYLGSSNSSAALNFKAGTSAKSGKWKVHAEVQLLFHYAASPKKDEPRVIASSKDACYLCYQFIKLDGHFQVPRTHGRVYPRWVIPIWIVLPEKERMRMRAAMYMLNERVESDIATVLNGSKTRHKHPNESTLFSFDQPSRSDLGKSDLTTPYTALSVSLEDPGIEDPISRRTVHAVRSPPQSAKQSPDAILDIANLEGDVFADVSAAISVEKQDAHLASSSRTSAKLYSRSAGIEEFLPSMLTTIAAEGKGENMNDRDEHSAPAVSETLPVFGRNSPVSFARSACFVDSPRRSKVSLQPNLDIRNGKAVADIPLGSDPYLQYH